MDRSAFRIGLVAALVTLVCAVSGSARAQSSPPSDAEKCSLSEQQKSGDDCVLCRAYYRNSAHCAHALTDYGYSKSCRMRGASMWREVWCRKKDPSARQIPADVLASLDDATAGESRGDASTTDDAAAASPIPSSSSASTDAIGDASPTADGPSAVTPKGQSSGCGTCAIGSGSGDGAFAAVSSLAVFVAFGARRRRQLTPSRQARSRRS